MSCLHPIATIYVKVELFTIITTYVKFEVCTIIKIYIKVEWLIFIIPGMRFGFGKNSGKFYVAIDSNPNNNVGFSYLR